MSEAFVNQVTLDCLLNKSQYSKFLMNKTEKISNKKDKKFYRKRIFSLTRELLILKEKPENLLPDVEYAFNNYVNSCVHYFKAIDSNDILQTEYTSFNELSTLDGLILGLEDDDTTSKEEADKLMMRSINIISNSSLDHFITRKITKKPEEIILPKQKDINLSDPILKNKGVIISDKKKNINNKYGETNNTEKKINEDKKEKYKNECNQKTEQI
jgi:hypothetical protein